MNDELKDQEVRELWVEYMRRAAMFPMRPEDIEMKEWLNEMHAKELRGEIKGNIHYGTDLDDAVSVFKRQIEREGESLSDPPCVNMTHEFRNMGFKPIPDVISIDEMYIIAHIQGVSRSIKRYMNWYKKKNGIDPPLEESEKIVKKVVDGLASKFDYQFTGRICIDVNLLSHEASNDIGAQIAKIVETLRNEPEIKERRKRYLYDIGRAPNVRLDELKY